LTIDEDLVDGAWSTSSIGAWNGTGWADSADSIDSSETCEAVTVGSLSVVDFIVSAFFGADQISIQKITCITSTLLGGWVVGCVEWTGDTVVVLDEEVVGALGADASVNTISIETETLLLGGIIGWVLSADIDAFLGGVVENGSQWALGAVISVLGQSGITDTFSLSVSCAGRWAWSTGNAWSVSGLVETGVADTEAESVVVAVGSTGVWLNTKSVYFSITWVTNTFSFCEDWVGGAFSGNWFGVVCGWDSSGLTKTIDSGITIQADASLTIIVLIWKIAVCIYDFRLNWFGFVWVLSLVSNYRWFSHDPSLSL
jgi:hypothetical protein